MMWQLSQCFTKHVIIKTWLAWSLLTKLINLTTTTKTGNWQHLNCLGVIAGLIFLSINVTFGDTQISKINGLIYYTYFVSMKS